MVHTFLTIIYLRYRPAELLVPKHSQRFLRRNIGKSFQNSHKSNKLQGLLRPCFFIEKIADSQLINADTLIKKTCYVRNRTITPENRFSETDFGFFVYFLKLFFRSQNGRFGACVLGIVLGIKIVRNKKGVMRVHNSLN